MTDPTSPVSFCQEPKANDPSSFCEASIAADQRCLAHLAPGARATWLSSLTPGADVVAEGVTFSQDLLSELLDALCGTSGTPEFGSASFFGAIFIGRASFDDASFSGDAFFEEASFNGSAVFVDASFNADAYFESASFNGGSLFEGASFSGDARFGGAWFREIGGFGAASFSKGALFEHAYFDKEVNFGNASFNGGARFEQVTFGSWVSFESVTLQGEFHMGAAAKRVNMNGLRGDGRMSLRLRVAEVDLTDVVLAGPVSVLGLDHPIESVDETVFAEGAAEASQVRVLSVQGLDASLVTLADVDLSRCRFAGMHRADQIVLDGQCVFSDGPGGRRRVLAEEHHWRASEGGGRSRHSDGWQGLSKAVGERLELVGPSRLEVLYRQLRKALEDAKNEPGAADFYYGEMEMRRAATTRRTERWLLGLYWAVSGYGLRVRRAAAWLALLMVLSIGGLTWFGFPQTATNQKATGTVVTSSGRQPIALTIHASNPVSALPDRFENAIEVTLNAVLFRNSDTELTTPGRYLNIATRVLGPILIGLTILAVRNQVKR